ncbi:hypothetical protein [Nocardia asiatica]|uniref:hypothetical protein n=1 Tax=Nocardia asiatica TaxID=209252 RepID=UPI0024562D96|nr:hypothetical protein [Nocardia asiatica]
MGVQLDEVLPIGEPRCQLVGRVDSEGGFANASHPVDRMDRYYPPSVGGVEDLPQFPVTA